MTDFYGILKSIIAEARADNAKLRASLYAQVRGMLDRQLDQLDPPPSAAARRQQYAKFEDAVRRIEKEIASRPVPTGPASAVLEEAPEPFVDETEAPLSAAAADAELAGPERPRRRRGGAALLALLLLIVIGGGGAFAYWRWDEVKPPLANLISEVRTRLGMEAVESPAEPMRQEAANETMTPDTLPDSLAPMAAMEDRSPAPASVGDEPALKPTITESPTPAGAPSAPSRQAQAEPAATPDKDKAGGSAATLASERAYLIIEQTPQGDKEERSAGTALWSLGGSGGDTSVAIAVSIPDRSSELSVVIRANADQSLPASHTIDLVHHAPSNGEGSDGLITAVPGIMVRLKNGDRSIPLRGAGALVVPGQYLLGLSGAPLERKQNMSLLKSAEWLVIPAQFESKRKSVFVIEMGASGRAAMDKAFAAWEAANPTGENQ